MKPFVREPNFPPFDYGLEFKEMYHAKGLHACDIDTPQHLFGNAINTCIEDLDGYLFVGNGEYGSQVNYCPMCGYKAKKSIND